MTAIDAVTGVDGDLFRVVGTLHGRRMEIGAEVPVAAEAAADYWRQLGATSVDWYLHPDCTYRRPVLVFAGEDDAVVHATALVPGKPMTEHITASCGRTIIGLPVRWLALAHPCEDCRLAIAQTSAVAATATLSDHSGTGMTPDHHRSRCARAGAA